MIRVQCLLPILFTLALLGISHCFTPPPPTEIKSHAMFVEVEVEKVIIRIQTRYKPELYTVNRLWFVNTLSPQKYSALHRKEYSVSYRINDIVRYYVDKDMLVIEMAKQKVTDFFESFNLVSVRLYNSKRFTNRRLEDYTYKLDRPIFSVDELSEPHQAER